MHERVWLVAHPNGKDAELSGWIVGHKILRELDEDSRLGLRIAIVDDQGVVSVLDLGDGCNPCVLAEGDVGLLHNFSDAKKHTLQK